MENHLQHSGARITQHMPITPQGAHGLREWQGVAHAIALPKRGVYIAKDAPSLESTSFVGGMRAIVARSFAQA